MAYLRIDGDKESSMCADQRRRFDTTSAADKVLELLAKLGDRGLDGPTRPVGQAANRRARHDADGVADFLENVQIFHPALAATDAFDNLQHPAGALATRRALAA